MAFSGVILASKNSALPTDNDILPLVISIPVSAWPPTITFVVAVTPLSALIVIVASPVLTPVITPFASTFAILSSEDSYFNDLLFILAGIIVGSNDLVPFTATLYSESNLIELGPKIIFSYICHYRQDT